jgi:hypothetical protein
MKFLKIGVLCVGIALICGGGWLAWRSAHPALSDPQQLQANLQAISEAAARHSSNGILNYLAEGFQWNGHDRHDVASMLSGAMFELDELDIDTNNVKIQVRGTTAVTTGDYTVTARQRKEDKSNVYEGKFQVEWEKQKGQWMAVSASSEGGSPI